MIKSLDLRTYDKEKWKNFKGDLVFSNAVLLPFAKAMALNEGLHSISNTTLDIHLKRAQKILSFLKKDGFILVPEAENGTILGAAKLHNAGLGASCTASGYSYKVMRAAR
jgi:hypothetical protein